MLKKSKILEENVDVEHYMKKINDFKFFMN